MQGIVFVLRTELLRTASFRIALVYAAVFSTSVLVLFAVIYLATAGYASRQLAGSVDEDLEALQTEFMLGGRNNLVVEIVSRIDVGQDRPRYYLLQSAEGRVLAGNVRPLPPRPGVRGWRVKSSLHCLLTSQNNRRTLHRRRGSSERKTAVPCTHFSCIYPWLLSQSFT